MSLQVSTQKGDFTISNQTTIVTIVKKKPSNKLLRIKICKGYYSNSHCPMLHWLPLNVYEYMVKELTLNPRRNGQFTILIPLGLHSTS